MKILKIVMAAGIIFASAVSSNAQNLGDILGKLGGSSSGSGSGNIISNVIEGVFTKSNLTLQDLVGEYTSSGPAVTFKSDNLLQKAGGIAGAAAIESKLQPYYEQYGLNDMSLTIDENANFTMKVKALSLKGTITKNDGEPGTFEFNFNIMGIKLGKFTAYIEKSGNNLNLMFDATKLKTIISYVAKFTGNPMASVLASLLDSYDGACIGWKMVSTAAASSSENSAISSGLDALKGLLNK